MFVMVGPPADPAQVRAAENAASAFQRIARANVTFVSRGDESGTHEREIELWNRAGIRPPPDRLLISGRGMALALRHANEVSGYTLCDEGTFRQFERIVGLVILFSGDPVLKNTYSVVHSEANARAARFAAWLTDGAGRDRITAYEITGRPAFTVPAH
jgi:tungstate transport system substrate-binding protein